MRSPRLLLVPLLALTTSAGLALGVGCSSLKDADPVASGGDGGNGATEGGPIGDDGSVAEAGDAEAGIAGEVCTEATCPVDVIEQGLYGPVSIAVNGTHLYWIEVGDIPPGTFGQLVRIAKASGCKARSCFDVLYDRVFTGQLQGQNIYEAHVALGVNDVCYTQSFNSNPEHSISCFALDTLAKRSLDTGPGAVIDLWLGGTEARWVLQSTSATSLDGAIMGRPLLAGTTTTLAGSRNRPIGVTSDGSKTYWTELGAASPQGTVQTLSADGGATAIATGRADPTAVRLYGQYLYWLEAAKKVVMRGRVDGTGVPEQIATTDDNPFDLAVDASGVYWTSSGLGASGVAGSLAHAPLTPGGAITIMMKDIKLVYSLAADATHIYVASVGDMIADGRIVRIKKTR